MAYISRTDADALIPVETSNEIIAAVPQSSAAMQSLRRLPNMSAKQRKLPVLSQLAMAGFVPEMGLKSTDKYAWDNVMLEAEEIAVIIPIPEAVLDDAEYDIWGQIRPQIVTEFGRVFDAAVFFGTDKPSTWQDGIVTQAIAASQTVAEGTGIDIAADISDAMGLVEEGGWDVNRFVSSNRLKAKLRGLRSTTGEPIYQPSLTQGTPSTIYGVPYYPVMNGSWDNSTALVLAGDFSNAVYAIRQDITYKVLDQAVLTDSTNAIIYNLAQNDMVALRVVMRLAWAVAKPISRLSDTAFPFAVVTP